ncbi:fimbria/pilus outer membrane usher protein [Pectobacterium zantedeschiae]|uniref:Fimbrial biogenesis outer membrane usher protein n=1 Tax=Pectobacterium zantedeschiae TaxID=2034769 RepID=A0A9X8JJ05_9GAMM|nr:fimbria/pilus outer membrane usher protein [Pectobacterium zantedeschiae]RYC43728.1 fimbrial biogenesis outer membrane usher protein [Pectobacterium zantedeschiae]RYC49051.1 fimbrial assembly protein [Pectobacterium zantedeschiae]
MKIMHLFMYASFALLYSATVFAEDYTDLPAPPRAMPSVGESIYYLTLSVNGQSDDEVVPVTYRAGNYYVDAAALRSNYVRLPDQSTGLVNVSALPEVTADYDQAIQQLKLTVPTLWLPEQSVEGGGQNMERYSARSSPGLLFNYNLYYTSPRDNSDSLSSWMEQRFFSPYGTLSNTGIYYFTSGSSNTQQDGYQRFDTYWRYNDNERMITYQVGDLISNSLTWSNSVRMGGLRIARNFGLRPDIVTYPMLQYTGTTAVPSTLDLFINGYKANSTSLNAGPFTLTNTPYLNGAGEATVITTDAQGRQISTTIPFYVSNTLLRKGLSDFDLSVGVLRQNYGVQNNSYTDDPAVSGIYRYGLTNTLTVSAHGEAVQGLYLLGAGTDFTLGRWGTLSSSYSQSEKEATGHQYTAGYSYYTSAFGLSVQHAKRSEEYRDLTAVLTAGRLSKESNQATISSQIFGEGNGSFGVGYFDIRAYDSTRTRLLNLSFSRQVWQGSSLYLAFNKELGGNGYSTQLQFVMPFGNNGNINAGVQRDSNGDYSPRVGINRTAPTEGGFGWNAAYGAGKNPYHQGALNWRSPYAMLTAGTYGNEGNTTQWGEMSGSLIYMNGGLFPSNRINDAFIVVDTEGYPDVPVKYENQLVGKTNKRGHLLVPWVVSNYPAKVEIDTLQLPANVTTPHVESRVSVKEGSGTVVTFPVHVMRSANIMLRNTDGNPLTIGTWITDEASGNTTISGYDGLAYFANLGTSNRLRFKQEDGRLCRVAFSLPESQTMMATIGPLTCQTDSKG